ncbi:MAG: polymer-forming cytoskeletal protein [Acidobacteriota bacterium]
MWKSRKPEEEKETFSPRKEEQPMSAFEERKPMETRFDTKPAMSKEEVINIGKSVFIKGELTGDEDLTIEGRVEGKIELRDHNLIIGPNGKINAEINAKNVTVIGSVVGNITASEIVELKSSGSVVGDIKSMRVSIADGAHFKGSVDMQRSPETAKKIEVPKAEPAKVSSDPATLPKIQVK